MHGTIHDFAALSRFNVAIEGALCLDWQMDIESRAFFEVDAGTPLPCPRPMIAQPIIVWTPVRIAGTLFTSLVSVPRQLVPAAITRRRA
jgi:hypothetical protein